MRTFLIFILLSMTLAGAASASPVYVIDPETSYLSVDVPAWRIATDLPHLYAFVPEGDPAPEPMIGWAVTTVPQHFPIRGLLNVHQDKPFGGSYPVRIDATNLESDAPADLHWYIASAVAIDPLTGALSTMPLGGSCVPDSLPGIEWHAYCVIWPDPFPLQLSGSLGSDMLELNGFKPALVAIYDLISFWGRPGQLPPELPPVSYATIDSYSYHIVATRLPEPGTAGLLLIALLALASHGVMTGLRNRHCGRAPKQRPA